MIEPGAAIQLACIPVFLVMYSNGTNGQGVVEIVEVTVGLTWIASMALVIMSRRPLLPLGARAT